MSKENKSLNEGRMELYRKLGLKPKIVHKTGAGVIFSSRAIRKGDK